MKSQKTLCSPRPMNTFLKETEYFVAKYTLFLKIHPFPYNQSRDNLICVTRSLLVPVLVSSRHSISWLSWGFSSHKFSAEQPTKHLQITCSSLRFLHHPINKIKTMINVFCPLQGNFSCSVSSLWNGDMVLCFEASVVELSTSLIA